MYNYVNFFFFLIYPELYAQKHGKSITMQAMKYDSLHAGLYLKWEPRIGPILKCHYANCQICNVHPTFYLNYSITQYLGYSYCLIGYLI